MLLRLQSNTVAVGTVSDAVHEVFKFNVLNLSSAPSLCAERVKTALDVLHLSHSKPLLFNMKTSCRMSHLPIEAQQLGMQLRFQLPEQARAVLAGHLHVAGGGASPRVHFIVHLWAHIDEFAAKKKRQDKRVVSAVTAQSIVVKNGARSNMRPPHLLLSLATCPVQRASVGTNRIVCSMYTLPALPLGNYTAMMWRYVTRVSPQAPSRMRQTGHRRVQPTRPSPAFSARYLHATASASLYCV